MPVLLMLLTCLTAAKLIEAELAPKRSEAVSAIGLSNCIGQLHIQHANLTKVLECLQRSDNRTAFMEDTFWKLDLLNRRLDRLDAMQKNDVYVPSPYENIDDVLNIKGSVASYNCQHKQHVVQAIRRKLHQVHLLNGNESPLFKWPFASQRTGGLSVTKELNLNASPASRLPESRLPESESETGGLSMTKGLNLNAPPASRLPESEYQQISCLIVEAIERHAETVPKPKDHQ